MIGAEEEVDKGFDVAVVFGVDAHFLGEAVELVDSAPFVALEPGLVLVYFVADGRVSHVAHFGVASVGELAEEDEMEVERVSLLETWVGSCGNDALPIQVEVPWGAKDDIHKANGCAEVAAVQEASIAGDDAGVEELGGFPLAEQPEAACSRDVTGIEDCLEESGWKLEYLNESFEQLC